MTESPRSGDTEQERRSGSKEASLGSAEANPNVHLVDYASDSGGTLLPMLISGLVLIVVAMFVVMIFF